MSEAVPRKPHVDEDVDDLDEILDEFTPQEAPKSSPAPAASASADSAKAAEKLGPVPPPDLDDFSENFAAEFAKQMKEALGELDGAEPSSSTGKTGEQDEVLRKAWEKSLVDDLNGVGSEPQDQFQKNIQEAMNRLKQSDSTLQENAAAGGEDLDKLLELLDNETTDDELNGFLEGLMGQLMRKEVLYDPLKELDDKFPDYMKTNGDKLSKEDKTRYEAQIVAIKKILAAFDDPHYKDDDPGKNVEIVTLMNEMQTHGSPPKELMGPLPPGLSPDNAGVPDECKIA